MMEKKPTSRKQTNTQKQELIIKPPDGGYGWVVLVASFFVSFIIDGVMYSFGIVLDEIKAATGEPDDICNLLNGLNAGFLFCSGPIVAGLVNQLGCRAVVMGGGLVTACMYMLTIFMPNIWAMLFTYGFIAGISTGCTYITSLIVVAQYFDKKRGIATGITMAGSGVGSFVFAPLIGFLIKSYNWEFTFSVCACFILQTVICGALMRPIEPTPAQNPKLIELENIKSDQTFEPASGAHSSGGHSSAKAVETHTGSLHSLHNLHQDNTSDNNSCLQITTGILKDMTDLSLLIQNLGFFLVVMSNFIVFLGFFTPFLYITKVAEDNGISKEKAAFLISIVGIVNIPTRMLFGFIADRRIITPINLNTLSVAICTVALSLYFKLQYFYWSQIIFAVTHAIGIAGINCLTTMYLVDLVGMKKFSNATGIVNLFRGFGCFVGPFLSGIISDKFGRVECFFFSAICFGIGLVLSLLVSLGSMRKSKNRDNEAADDGNEVERNPLSKN